MNLKCSGNQQQKKCALYTDGEYTRAGVSSGHKYLVKVLQIRETLSDKRKSKIQEEYFRRVKLYRSKVKSENLISVINNRAVEVVRFSPAIVG